MGDALYQEIVASRQTESALRKTDDSTIWLVFKAGEQLYAINSADVREIVRNADCYPMPFVPPYIKGVLNSYGTPYSVLDLSLFLENQSIESRLFLILKNKNNVALQISDIQEFHAKSEVVFQEFANKQDSAYFSGAILFDVFTAPVLNLPAIIEKVRADIEAC